MAAGDARGRERETRMSLTEEDALRITEDIIERGDLPILGQDPSRTYRLGIMGGTFDPIHHGHLVAAEQAFDDLDLDVVVFMPAGSPAFKQDKHVSASEDRYAMTLRPLTTRTSSRAASRSTVGGSPIRQTPSSG